MGQFSNCVELFKQWATCFVSCFLFFSFPSFLLLLAYLFLFFPLGNGLKPVLELAMMYSGGKLKKLDEIRLGSLELPLMCLLIHLRKVRLNKRMGLFVANQLECLENTF